MSDLISRADAIEAVRQIPYCERGRLYECDVISRLEALPSADAVPFDVQLQSTREVIARFAEDRIKVVRCKDCRWYMDDYMGTWCGRFKGFHGTKEDDYCSHGERAEQTDYKLPDYEEIMDKLDKLTLKGDKND